MSARFEVVRTDAKQPWHARIRAANGRIVWHTENYRHRAGAHNAINSIVSVFSVFATPRLRYLDGRLEINGVEVRDVDERTPPAPPLTAEPPFYLGTYTHYAREGRRTTSERREFWHDRDYHWRMCADDENCNESTPPNGAKIRVRGGEVTR